MFDAMYDDVDAGGRSGRSTDINKHCVELPLAVVGQGMQCSFASSSVELPLHVGFMVQRRALYCFKLSWLHMLCT